MTAPRPLHCRLILIAAVMIVFGRLLLCDFTHWDDQHTIHHNPHLNPVSWSGLAFHWTTPTASIYIPLTFTVWAALATIAHVNPDPTGISLNPLFFHGANLLIHAAGALAAWALLRRLIKNDLAALLGALLWAVHPVQVESLGWASGLKDVLSGTLVLATLAAYVRFRQADKSNGASTELSDANDHTDGVEPAAMSQIEPDHHGRRWYGMALGLYALALLAKPSAFTLPLLVVATEWLALRTPWRRVIIALIPFVILTLPIALIARAVQQAPAAAAPAWVRGLLVGDTMAFYALKVIAPIELAFDYGRSIATLREGYELYYAWLLPAGVAVALAGAYGRARRAGRPLSPLWALGAVWFVLAPLHVLGLTRFDFQIISTVADHYLYVAMIGPALLLACCVARWPRVAMGASVLVAVYGVRAAWQTPVWQDDQSLFGHTLRVTPRSWTSWLNLAVRENVRGNPQSEHDYLLRAEAIVPYDPSIGLNLMTFYMVHGETEKSDSYAHRVIEAYRKTWQSDALPATAAHAKIVGLYINGSQFDLATKYLDEGLRIEPDDVTLNAYATRLQWKRQTTQPAARP